MWKCLTYARPSSAGQTWAWSPCRRGRCGRCGRWQGGTKRLPAAQKASLELSLETWNFQLSPKGLIRTFTFNPANVQTSEFHAQLWQISYHRISRELLLECWGIKWVGRQCFSSIEINLVVLFSLLLHVISRIQLNILLKRSSDNMSIYFQSPRSFLDLVILSEINRKALVFFAFNGIKYEQL